MRTHLWAHDTHLLADDIQLQTMQREHFTIYASLYEVSFQYPPLISALSSVYGCLVGHLLI